MSLWSPLKFWAGNCEQEAALMLHLPVSVWLGSCAAVFSFRLRSWRSWRNGWWWCGRSSETRRRRSLWSSPFPRWALAGQHVFGSCLYLMRLLLRFDCAMACMLIQLVLWIPFQVMAINESSRLVDSLRKEEVPVNRLIVNQVMSSKPTDCKFCNMKRKVSHLSLTCYS